MNRLVGVILAAGKGSRMLPVTARWPKAVLPILAKPLVHHQIELLRGVGVRKVFVVVGHLGAEVTRALGHRYDDVEVEYVEQTETLGIAHALGQLEGRVQQPFILCLGDIYFVSSRLRAMIDLYGHQGTVGVLASKVEARPEMIRRNFAILADDEGRVHRVIEKPRSVQNKLKGCGIYLFGPEVFDAIRRTPRTAMRDEYEITDTIQIMIDDGHRVVHADVIDEDLNLTVPEDLLSINAWELDRRGLAHHFEGAAPDLAGRSLSRVVVGRGASLGADVDLRDCVIFDGSVVPDGARLARAIITPEGVLQCHPAEGAT